MEGEKTQVNLRDILSMCRSVLGDLDKNSLLAFLRNQNEAFDKAILFIEKYLPVAENAFDKDKVELSIKTATIFLISLWAKFRQGGSVSEFTKDDWEDIIGKTAENAAIMDPQEYSMMVFDLYRRSIVFAIEPMSANASQSVINRMEEIVSLMASYEEDLKAGAMSEVSFIEENLWLSLEAIFLVMTDRMSRLMLTEERQELAEAVSALVFQKYRFKHYDEELAAVDECLEYQAELDQRLTEHVDAYIDALKEELDAFDAHVERAFSTEDFQIAFRGSIDLAESLGARNILKTQAEVDDYFIS